MGLFWFFGYPAMGNVNLSTISLMLLVLWGATTLVLLMYVAYENFVITRRDVVVGGSAKPRFNRFALTSFIPGLILFAIARILPNNITLILFILWAIPMLFLGIVARKQIKKTSERGLILASASIAFAIFILGSTLYGLLYYRAILG